MVDKRLPREHNSVSGPQVCRGDTAELFFKKERYGTFEAVKLESAAFGGLKDLDIWE